MRLLSAILMVVQVLGIIGIGKSTNQSIVNVELYYEILCPDCVQFVTEQVCPLWKKMGSYFDIEFIPYGNAETKTDPSTGNVTIVCQHGKNECFGNIMHACALKYLPVAATTNFICCTMGEKHPHKAGPKCAHKVGLDFSEVQKCLKGDEGLKLLKGYGDKTDHLNPKHTFVPWILFNGIYNHDDMSHAEQDLLSVVCKYLEHPVPRECNEI